MTPALFVRLVERPTLERWRGTRVLLPMGAIIAGRLVRRTSLQHRQAAHRLDADLSRHEPGCAPQLHGAGRLRVGDDQWYSGVAAFAQAPGDGHLTEQRQLLL